MLACTHPRQDERLRALQRFEILDTPREEEFDDIVDLVAQICDAPVAVINFIDANRQWFKAEVGLGVRSTPLDTSLCSHVILERDYVEIGDTLADQRMSDNPLCLADGGFRFYAGALLMAGDGLPIGTLCVLDTKPRELTDLQRRSIETLAKRVMTELNLRLALSQARLLRREIDHRVKNSLASVSAIISLQSARSDDPKTREALGAIQSRLGALEALHEELQQDHEEDRVDIARLIRRSVDKLRNLVPEHIEIEIDIDPRDIGSDEANAIALAVNEFVTNSAKHGFDGGRRGTVQIQGERSRGGYRLRCSDDGAGNAETLTQIANSGGLGSRIIRTLAASVGAQTNWRARNPGIELEWLLRSSDEALDLDQSITVPPSVRE